MSIFDSIGDVVSKATDWITPSIASAASGVAGFLGQQQSNATNVQLAKENNLFQERMSNTAYQRQVKDMESAGLNPMLAYLKGGGASTPSGSVAYVQNPYAAGASSAESASRTSLANKQVPKVGAEIENIGADTISKRANTLYTQALQKVAGATEAEKRASVSLIEHQAKKISEEIKIIPSEGKRLQAAAQQLVAAATNLNNQSLTEVQREAHMKALITKTLQESKLLKADVEALEKAGNLGKEFGQYKPIIDTITSILRVVNR